MSLRNIVENAIVNKASNEDTAKKLCSFSIMELCSVLKEFLCDPKYAHHAIDLLVKCTCQSIYCSEEFFFISKFICRVEDDPSPAVLSALDSLFQNAKQNSIACSSELFEIVYDRIILRINVQSEALPQRKRFFSILGFILTKENIPNCDTPFLQKLFYQFDGERNPGLVLSLLVFVKLLCDYANRICFHEVIISFFELVTSYFPIVFSQTQNTSVTKEDLQEALLECMSHSIFEDQCLPFLYLRVNSPSLNVKKEVYKTLNACLISYQKISVLQFKEVFAVIRDEAKKISLSDDVTKEVIPVCCTLLETLSKIANSFPCDILVSLFSSFAEDIFSCLENFEVSQMYATYISYIFRGSWNICVELCPYLCNWIIGLNNCKSSPPALIILSAIFTSIADVVTAKQPELSNLKRNMDNNFGLLLRMIEETCDSVVESDSDEFTSLCRAEFLVSFLRFHLLVGVGTPESTRTRILFSLLEAAKTPSYASERISFLVSEYAALDWTNTRSVIEDFLRHCSSGLSMQLKSLISRIGSSSSTAAASVITQVFSYCFPKYSDESKEIAECILSAVDPLKEEDAQKILDILQDSDAEKNLVPFCYLFSKCSSEFCKHELRLWKNRPLSEIAAILNVLRSTQFDEEDLKPLIQTFILLVEQGKQEKLVVGLNGLIGCYVSLSSLKKFIWNSADRNFCICYLWAASFLQIDALPQHSLEQCFSSIFSSSVENILELFSLKPVYLVNSKNINNTLLRYVVDYADFIRTIGSDELFNQVLLSLLSHENGDEITKYSSQLLFLARTESSQNKTFAFSVILSVYKSDKKRERTMEIMSDSLLANAVFNGVKSSSLHNRCAIFNLLREVGEQCSDKNNNLCTRLKEEVLSKTLSALSDPKRLVRQAAANCRHVWFFL